MNEQNPFKASEIVLCPGLGPNDATNNDEAPLRELVMACFTIEDEQALKENWEYVCQACQSYINVGSKRRKYQHRDDCALLKAFKRLGLPVNGGVEYKQ